MSDIDAYLAATPYIESEAPGIVALAAEQARATPEETAVALFD